MALVGTFAIAACESPPASPPPDSVSSGFSAPPVVAESDLTAPRPDDDRELAPLLAKAREAVERGAGGAALLAEEQFSPLRELTVFHHLVRDRAPSGALSMLPPGEPGQPLEVRGVVKDQHGRPVVDALVYAYQTSQKGWYSDRAPHFSGMDANEKHARLFGYVRTDAVGQFVLHTIRPGGYPHSTVPEHIHVHVDVGEQNLFTGGVVFDDDVRLTRELREQSGRDLIVEVERRDSRQIVRPEFRVQVPAVATK